MAFCNFCGLIDFLCDGIHTEIEVPEKFRCKDCEKDYPDSDRNRCAYCDANVCCRCWLYHWVDDEHINWSDCSRVD